MQWFFPCIIFYNSEYTQRADLNVLIERLRQRFLENQYADIPIRSVDVARESATLEDLLNRLGLSSLEELLSRYGISLADITDEPTFVIEHGLTKQKFQDIGEYLQALTEIMRPTRS